MQRFRVLLAEAMRSLGANVSTTAAATMAVLIGMFLLGFLIGLSTWAFSLSNHYKHELVVKVCFNRGVPENRKQVSTVAARPMAKRPVTPRHSVRAPAAM